VSFASPTTLTLPLTLTLTLTSNEPTRFLNSLTTQGNVVRDLSGVKDQVSLADLLQGVGRSLDMMSLSSLHKVCSYLQYCSYSHSLLLFYGF